MCADIVMQEEHASQENEHNPASEAGGLDLELNLSKHQSSKRVVRGQCESGIIRLCCSAVSCMNTVVSIASAELQDKIHKSSRKISRGISKSGWPGLTFGFCPVAMCSRRAEARCSYRESSSAVQAGSRSQSTARPAKEIRRSLPPSSQRSA